MTDSEHKEWLQKRKLCIGGSDAAAVCGVSSFRTALDVYADKVGLSEKVEPTVAMQAGTFMEPFILKMAEKELGQELVAGKFVRDIDHSFIGGTPDAIGKDCIVEAKYVGEYMSRQFGDSGDDVPECYLLQCHHYMMLTKTQSCYLAAFFAGRAEFRMFHIKYDQEMCWMLTRTESEFWNNHVLPRVPPPEKDPSVVKEFLAKRYPKNVEPMLRVENQAIMDHIVLYSKSRNELKIAEARKTEDENFLKEIIGSAAGLEWGDGKISWKRTKDGERTDWFEIAQELSQFLPSSVAYAEMINKHTSMKPGYRVFRPSGELFKGETE